VPETTTSLLLLTAVSTAIVHTLIPDHWLPFVLVGRARRWTVRQVAATAGFSAAVHAILSVALGLATLGIGHEAARALGEGLERASAVLLVVFGLAYAVWAWRKGGHFHPGGGLLHRDEDATPCAGDEGAAHPEHLHYHADDAWIRGGAGRGALTLAVIVGLNPCVLLLPIVVAAAPRGATTLALVIAAYAIVTVTLMVALSVVGVLGRVRIPIPAVARHMETASGLLIAIVGGAFLLLHA